MTPSITQNFAGLFRLRRSVRLDGIRFSRPSSSRLAGVRAILGLALSFLLARMISSLFHGMPEVRSCSLRRSAAGLNLDRSVGGIADGAPSDTDKCRR